jgi:hypothetical protein
LGLLEFAVTALRALLLEHCGSLTIALVKSDPNWECYLALSQRRFAGKYVVIAAGKFVGAGKDLGRLLRKARKLHPKSVPFVTCMRDPRKLYA